MTRNQFDRLVRQYAIALGIPSSEARQKLTELAKSGMTNLRRFVRLAERRRRVQTLGATLTDER